MQTFLLLTPTALRKAGVREARQNLILLASTKHLGWIVPPVPIPDDNRSWSLACQTFEYQSIPSDQDDAHVNSDSGQRRPQSKRPLRLRRIKDLSPSWLAGTGMVWDEGELKMKSKEASTSLALARSHCRNPHAIAGPRFLLPSFLSSSVSSLPPKHLTILSCYVDNHRA